MYQQFNNGFQQPQQNYGYAQPTFGQPYAYGNVMPNQTMFKDITVTNPMTKEDLALLKQNPNKKFDMNIKPEDIAKAKCPHKNANSFLVHSVGENMFECTQCRQRFTAKIRPKEEIEAAVETMVNYLEQMKLYAINFDEDFYKDYMMMIPLLRKAPDLYEMAVQNFEEVTRIISGGQTINPNMNHSFNRYGMEAYQDVFSGNFGSKYNVYNQMPVYNMQPQQAGYYQQNPQMYGYQQPAPQGMQQPQMGQQAPQNMQPQMNQQVAYQAPQMQPQQGPVFGNFVQQPAPQQGMQQPQMGQAPVAPNMNPFNNAYTAPMAMQAPQTAPPVQQAQTAPEQKVTETKVTI